MHKMRIFCAFLLKQCSLRKTAHAMAPLRATEDSLFFKPFMGPKSGCPWMLKLSHKLCRLYACPVMFK